MENIYPEIEIRETEKTITFSTTLRKEYNGDWYLWNFFKKYEVIDQAEKLKYTALFHQEVYFTIVLGVIQDDVLDMYGNKMFTKDKDQISEKDRIINKVRF